MASPEKHANRIPDLSMNDMTRILDNVYAACQIEPAQIPLESVVSYTKYRMERFSIQKTIALVAFVLFILVPFLFIAPNFTVTQTQSEDSAARIYSIQVLNNSPVRSITADINGFSLPIHNTGNHIYTVQPTQNGLLTITVTMFNGQSNSYELDVEGVDSDAPVLVANSNDSEYLYLTLDDGDGLGILYEGIYATTIDGETISPVSYDPSCGEVVFAYPKSNMNITIPDLAGNTLKLAVSRQDA